MDNKTAMNGALWHLSHASFDSVSNTLISAACLVLLSVRHGPAVSAVCLVLLSVRHGPAVSAA